MAVTLKRQLDDAEKKRVLEQHGRVCFATGHTLADQETVQFDHIRSFALGGPSDLSNVAPMCARHNNQKGTLPLFDFRIKLMLEDFFNQGDRLTLGHLLEYLREKGDISNYGLPLNVKHNETSLRIESANFTGEFQVYHSPQKGWDYFYATLPIDVLGSDDSNKDEVGLQPRYLIYDKVFELFRHFQTNPVLQPSLGRVADGRIKLFDGQHKAAALLWNGYRELECKIYLDPDVRKLNETNISAHDKFSQTRFFTSIMVMKLGTQFGTDFDEYKNLEDGQTKSEEGFVRYLANKDSLKQGDVSKRFQSFLYHCILEDDKNRLARLVSYGNRATADKPLTLHGLVSSLFMSFLYRHPVNDDMATDAYKRGIEAANMVNLMNIFDDMGLKEWNSKVSNSDNTQLKLERIVRARFMKAWTGLLKDAICASLALHDTDERSKPLYRDLSDKDIERIRYSVSRLVDWKMWSSPVGTEIDTVRLDSDKLVRDWIREKGLTTGYLAGAPE